MPRKRDLLRNLFNPSQNPSPAPSRTQSPVQQPASSNATLGLTASTTVAGPSNVIQPVISLSSTHDVVVSAASQASSPTVHPVSGAVLLPSSVISSGNQLNQSSSISSSVRGVASVAWEGVKTALVILKESSDWLPQLKAATGGLVALIDAVELASNNVTDLELLRQNINDLTSIFKENSRDRSFPWLRRRLSDFAEELNKIVKNIEEKLNHGNLRRFAEGKKDEADLAAFARAISHLVTNLQSELTLYTSRGINELLSSESLKKLNESDNAHYDTLHSAKVVQRRGCTPNTRQSVLEDLMKWATDPQSSKIYWINGMAGTGKTTIAYSFCEQLEEKGLLGANFFCSRSLAECSDIRYIIPTIARQLARSCPQFASALLEVLDGDFRLSSLPRTQLKRLLLEPFQHISESITDTLVIVIDALDECGNEASEIQLFLEQIHDSFATNAIPLKVFVSSRPEVAIRYTITPLKPTPPPEWFVLHIHDIEKSLVQEDIKVYVEDELVKIANTRRLEDGWPPSTEVDAVVANADRLFIYAATVIRYVKVDSGNPRRRLSELASTSQVGIGTSSRGTELIDGLYRVLLERALGEKNQEEAQVARMVLKLIVCTQTPLTIAGIADFLNTSAGFEIEVSTSDVRTALELLPSVISFPIDDDGIASTFHASFPDFLFDIRRCGSINHIPFRKSHLDLARMCLHFMDKSLITDNISGSDRWQTVDAITKEKKVESWIPNALAYACMFWASHIDTDDEIESLSEELVGFLTHQLLRWLEVLSLLRRLDIGVEVLQRMKECEHRTLSFKFDDAYKFLKDILDIINVWPGEVFYSGLVWAPEQSFVRKTYFEVPTPLPRVACGLRADWGACELTMRGHFGSANAVAVSPDDRHVVSGSSDQTVRIWNVATGEEEHVLQGHSDGVTSVAVSPDNRHIISGSMDNTVRIWEASTGGEGHVCRGHSDGVTSVAVSPDNRHIVSGSDDKTVRIWDMSTGKEERVFRGHSNQVTSVAVSPDKRRIVSGSRDNTIRIWSVSTGEEEHVLRGHSASVNSVVVSPDNHQIVSGSSDNTIRIWNALTAEEEHVLRGHSESVLSVASLDNRHIVSGSSDNSVRIWKSTGEEEQVFRGHSGSVISVTVSPNNRHVVSASQDATVKIWNASAPEEGVLRGHSEWVYSVAISPDGRHVVSGSQDATVRIWDVSSGEEKHVLQGHSGWVFSVAVLPDNHRAVSGDALGTIRIWDILTGEEEQALQGHWLSVMSLAVSPDNCHVVSASLDTTIRIWNASTGEEEHALHGTNFVTSVAFFPDSSHVVSASLDGSCQIWNALSGELKHVFRGDPGWVYSVAVSPDNRYVVSAYNTIRVWNMLSDEDEPPLVIVFAGSFDNCHVVSGPQVDAIPIKSACLSLMVTSVARALAQGDNDNVLQRLASGESLDFNNVFLRELGDGLPLIPFTLTPDQSSILLSNGQKFLAIPSCLRDFACASFSGSKACFGHQSGRITILDISA